MTVLIAHDGPVAIVTIDRPDVRNAVDRPTADRLEGAFRGLDADPDVRVAVLTGAGGTFCAGADLHALAQGDAERTNRVEASDHAPMGPTRLALDLPVIAAIEGYAVAGGLELAVWCDLRVAAQDAVLGVFCRRWGVPLIDGGTQRLPRLIGGSRALDLILTGRAVAADEALAIGLVNRVTPPGEALGGAVSLAHEIAAFPQACVRADRASARRAFDQQGIEGLLDEHTRGVASLASGEMLEGLARFEHGAGRGGSFEG